MSETNQENSFLNLSDEEMLNQLPPEQARQHPDREQVSTFRRMPLLRSIQCPAGDQAVQVDMLAEVLPPRVQYRCHPQLPVEAFAVMPQRVERVPHAAEQGMVNHRRVQPDPTVQLMRQGEHQMEVRCRYNIGQFTLLPLLAGLLLATRAMAVAAGMVKRDFLAAFPTAQLETTQGSGAARQQLLAHLVQWRWQRWQVRLEPLHHFG